MYPVLKCCLFQDRYILDKRNRGVAKAATNKIPGIAAIPGINQTNDGISVDIRRELEEIFIRFHKPCFESTLEQRSDSRVFCVKVFGMTKLQCIHKQDKRSIGCLP